MPNSIPLTTIVMDPLTVGASAVPIALTVKIMPATTIILRRPKQSVGQPIVAPTTAPIQNKANETIYSMWVAERGRTDS